MSYLNNIVNLLSAEHEVNTNHFFLLSLKQINKESVSMNMEAIRELIIPREYFYSVGTFSLF